VILILDAHALLWWLSDSSELGPEARRAIADPLNEVLVSAATVWEIEIKRALRKLDAPAEVVEALEPAGMGSLPITLADARNAGALPPHHRDPFDRMLAAQASRLDAVVVSRDAVFESYGVVRLPT
jgi:PIN domain nuclease of toxin-antitoxin system